MFDIARHQKKTSVKDFTTLGTEETLGSLWEREEYINMCSNPRKTFNELTQQEKRLFQDAEQIRDKHSNGLGPAEKE